MKTLIVLRMVLCAGLGAGTAWLAAEARAQAPAASSLDNDAHLVAWWSFDKVQDGQVLDSSPAHHTATAQGGLKLPDALTEGRVGRAVRLDGKAWLEVPAWKGVIGQQPRTLVAWIKTKRARGQIISWGKDDFGKMWRFGFIRGRVGVSPKGGYLYMRDETHDGQWHQVAVVVHEGHPPNFSNHTKLYLDGQPAVIHDIGLLDLWPIDTGAEQNVQIGRGLIGLLDEVRIYDRALSDDEIHALYQSVPPQGRQSS